MDQSDTFILNNFMAKIDKWKFLNPRKWTKFDSFCWLNDWLINNNVTYSELENLFFVLPSGKKLCYCNYEFFVRNSPHFGIEIFVDLQILISSYDIELYNRMKNLENRRIEKNIMKLFLKSELFSKHKKFKYYKVHDFLKDILNDSRYNPHIIKWKDKDNGVFIIKEPDEVAKLWGKSKDNEKMTYEKMSRAIRYGYINNKFIHFGDKFTYKFCS